MKSYTKRHGGERNRRQKNQPTASKAVGIFLPFRLYFIDRRSGNLPPSNRRYFKSDFSQVERWLLGEDGKVLRQVAGKPIYTASIVKYAELMCYRPCGQAMLSGITEA